MRWFTFLCILFCISLIQSSLTYWINIGSAVPDLYFSLIIFYSFLADLKQNAIANWLTGFSKDMVSEGPFGMNSVFFVAIGFFVWSSRGLLYRGHVITHVLVTFIFAFIYNVLYAIHTATSFHSLCFSATVWTIFACSLYTAMVIPIFFWVFGKFQPTQNLFHNRK